MKQELRRFGAIYGALFIVFLVAYWAWLFSVWDKDGVQGERLLEAIFLSLSYTVIVSGLLAIVPSLVIYLAVQVVSHIRSKKK